MEKRLSTTNIERRRGGERFLRAYDARKFEMEMSQKKTPWLIRLADPWSRAPKGQREWAARKLVKHNRRSSHLESLQSKAVPILRRIDPFFR